MGRELTVAILDEFPQLRRPPAPERVEPDAVARACAALERISKGEEVDPVDHVAGGAGLGGAMISAMLGSPDWKGAVESCASFSEVAVRALDDNHFEVFGVMLRAGVAKAAEAFGVEVSLARAEMAAAFGPIGERRSDLHRLALEKLLHEGPERPRPHEVAASDALARVFEVGEAARDARELRTLGSGAAPRPGKRVAL